MMKRSTALLQAIALVLGIFLLTMATAYAQTANTATISFTAPTQRLDGTTPTGTLSYKVYQGIKGQTKAVVGTISTTTSTITTGLLGGTEYCWQVSATETIGTTAGPESALSNEACKAFPVSGLRTVTITVQ
jgi:hypothetical protein